MTGTPPRRGLCALLALLLCAVCALPARAAGADGTILLTGRFDSPAYPDRELSWQFPYNDGWFTQPANDYNHQLAQCTLGMAVSAFRGGDQALERKDEYIKEYLGQAGFGDMVSEQFDQTPTAQTIATLIASKTLWDDEGEFLLVAAAVSGGGYQDEWLSNFSFGDDAVHQGFFDAAWTVYQRVFDYVDARAGGGRFKLWLGGYSRAAAVSNLTAVLAISAEQVAPEDLYAYTFATPNNCKPDLVDMGYDYSSIFNVTGMFDPVPSIPFAEWGYGKLGTTFRLPAQETTPDYLERRAPAEEIYREMTGGELTNNLEVNWFIQKLYQLIYDMVRTADSYQEDLEGVLDAAWNNKSSVFGLLRGLCGALNEDAAAGDMLLGEAPTANTLLSVFLYDLAMERLGLWANNWNDLAFTAQLFYEHCPEVYISWMMSQEDPAELFVFDTGYRHIFLSGGIDFSLADEDGNPMDPPCVDGLGAAVMVTVPSDRTWIMTLSGSGRVKAVEYSAGSLHYAYQIYELEEGDYRLTLPMDYWSSEEDGGMVEAAGGQEVPPLVQALDRSAVHPSAVFELEDSGFVASHALALALGIAIALLILLIVLVIIVFAALRRRRRNKRAARSIQPVDKKGGPPHDGTQ